MDWPRIRDFSNAVLNPEACFDDSELAYGDVYLHPVRRTPAVWPGTFAAVYKIAGLGQDFAVRCFTREVRDHQSRYDRLSQYLRTADPPGFVEFHYQPKGIRVGADWYPIVKMDWVNGQRLDEYIDDNASNRGAMQRIAVQWRETATDLQTRDIAHNDLQHGNVMVLPDGAIKLVDYDGSFLPQFRGNASPELGHSNYQHPERTSRDYDAHIDNFPALVIHLSLLAVAADPALWARYNNGENLIFTKNDFAQPKSSRLFQTLKSNGDATISHLAALLESYCIRPVAEIPTLENALQSNGATPRKAPTSPTTYRQLIQERQAASEHSENQPHQELSQNITGKIDRKDIFEFCRTLDGQTLSTLGGMSFVLEYSAPYGFIIRQGGNDKTLGKSDLNDFLDRFEEIQSWNGRDYRKIEGTATFCLAILLKYSTSHLVNILKNGVDLATMQAKLLTAQEQAKLDKAEANKQLQTERGARLKAESDTAAANIQLRAEQAARSQAEADKAAADQKLQDAQAELQAIRDAPAKKKVSLFDLRLKRRK